MKSKLFLFVLLSAVLFSLNPAHASPKITPGTKCPKAGVTQTYGGKRFTCLKLGNKLYWDNGKVISSLDAIANLPATCVISVPQWRTVSENRPPWQSGQTGTVYFSSLIVNSSISNVATNVRITVEWYDALGLSFKKIYRIPKIYTGAMPFGFIEDYSDDDKQWPTEPLDIRVSSTCSSNPIAKSELINGNFPIIKGQAPIDLRIDDPKSEYPIYELVAKVIVTNSLKKDLVFSGEGATGNAQIFGFLKDSLGNVLGGFTSRLYGDNNIEELAPGDSTRVEVQLDMHRPYSYDQAFLKRLTVFDYVIILN